MFEDNESQMSQEETDLRAELTNEIFNGADPVLPESASEELPEKDVDLPKKEVDPWEGVPEVLKTAIQGLQTRVGSMDNLETRLKQAESRVGGIDNRLRDMKASAPAARHPSKQEVETALSSSKGWKVFADDFPDHADAIKEIMIATNTGGAGVPVEVVEKMRADMNTDFEQRLNKQQLTFELKLLRSKYKDHATLVKEPDFMPWLQAQPQETKSQYGSWDALEGIDLLDKYTAHKASKAALPNIAKERQERLASSADAKRGSAAQIKTKNEADMTEAEYRRHLEKQIWRT